LLLVCALVLFVGAPVALADWDPCQPAKWVQFPDLDYTGLDVDATNFRLADDFLCTVTGPLTDFHIWCSWLYDDFGVDPMAVDFVIEIYNDIPADPCAGIPYSMPGTSLWQRYFPAGSFIPVVWLDQISEGWMEPPDMWMPDADWTCWQYNFFMDPCDTELFIQQGSQTHPIIYWLSVQAIPLQPGPLWGWKTSLDHWNDDAVWTPDGFSWFELRYPPSHPFMSESIDLAFVITGEEPEPMDFGDAPDPCYPTLLANNGARHIIGGPWFGDPCIAGDDMPDPEPEGQIFIIPGQPLGDDIMDGNDDEDGVIFPTLTIGVSTAVTVHVSDLAGGGGTVEIWIDYDSSGSWEAAELVFTGFLAVGTHNVPVTAPVGFTGNTVARCRISTQGTGSPVGLAPDGEVEDHAVTIEAVFDYGDAPAPYPTGGIMAARHVIDGVTFLGAGVDPEATGQPDPCALGDDNDGNDDEDGVVFTTQLVPGQPASVNVTASVAGQLDAWIDFLGDGDWSDPCDQAFFSVPLTGGGTTDTLPFVVPASAAGNIDTFARFRFSTAGGLSYSGPHPSGPFPDGEVEDYRVHIEAKRKWSQPPVEMDPCQPPTYYGWDEYSIYDGMQIAGDDWLCVDQRPVSDIHWWGSYYGWDMPEPPQTAPIGFHIGIWTDVPAGVDLPYSHPGMMVWEYLADIAEVNEQWVGWDYHEQHPMDTCFKYDLQIPEEMWFWQEGGDTVYWLTISAIYATMPPPIDYYWGWKTRPHFYNDDAIRIWMPTAPIPGMEFMDGEPILEGWDLAFELTTHECFPVDHVDYPMWVKAGYPPCWCPAPDGSDYQCKGDADGMFDGKDIDGKRQWVTLPDLTVLSGSWYKVDTDVTLPPNFICADFSHGFDGKDVDGKRQWVTLPDLTLLSGGWYKVDSDPHFTTSPCFP
jgi:hypothetical protein